MLAFAFLLATQPPAAPPTVEVPRVEDAAIVVDGVLDEDVWSRAARLSGFRQYEPVDGRPAEEETEVRVWYAPDALHFGIVARDREPGAIRATLADRDNIDGDDHVVLYLDTFNDQRRAFFFAVNPLGVQQDGVRAEGASSAGQTFGGSLDKSPDYWCWRPYAPLARVAGYGSSLQLRTPAFRRFDAERSAGRGRAPIFAEGAEGVLSELRGGLALRPSASVRAALEMAYQRIERERDGSEFARTLLPRAQLEYQPTRALFFRTIGEWRAERRAALVDARTGRPLRIGGVAADAQRTEGLRLDLLASYTPTPGTVVFLGYGASLGAVDTFAFRRLQRASDGVFLKLAYQFRR